jgi:hypothetical protein
VVLGKVVLLMEMAERKHKASKYPRAFVVAFKTVIYAIAVILFEFGERVVRAWHESGNLTEGIALVRAHANLDRFLALLILGCIMIAVYLAMEEISRAMGEGALTRLFFKRPERRWARRACERMINDLDVVSRLTNQDHMSLVNCP